MVINFSYNWNNKLDCKCFTTIRLTNSNKYRVGLEYEIHLKNQRIKNARIVGIKVFTLDMINEFISRIDTGYSKEVTVNIINRMYPDTVNNVNKSFMLILLETVK